MILFCSAVMFPASLRLRAGGSGGCECENGRSRGDGKRECALEYVGVARVWAWAHASVNVCVSVYRPVDRRSIPLEPWRVPVLGIAKS